MEDLAERELNNLCEIYYQDLLEEVIQSDFEKPSIPEVILSVITDLTKDDNNNIESSNLNSVYYFNPDTPRSNSSAGINTNDDIDYHYRDIQKTLTNMNSQETERSTDSSDQSITLIPINNQSSNETEVKNVTL
jgi:hypothetical protein